MKISLSIVLSILTPILLISISGFAQDSSKTKKPVRIQITDNTRVYDSLGSLIPETTWKKLVMQRDFGIKPLDPSNANTDFILTRYSVTDKEKIDSLIANMPKPKESTAFTTGEDLYKIKTTDIYGNPINTKEMLGKIIVLNFWFIKCVPCQVEIPELNKLVSDYKNDSSIVFLGIGLDDASEIADYISTTPFNYILIPEGKSLKRSYAIRSYPTNVVVDKQGKVYYHNAGFGPNTVYWLKKSIEEIKSKSP